MTRNFFKIEKGIKFSATTEPASPLEGSVYLDDTTGKLRIFMDGAWSDIGSGMGEISVIESPNNAADWVGVNATVVTTTVPAELPLGPTIPTAISITSSTSGGYARYRWTMPKALRGKLLKSEWHQIASGGTSGDFKIEIYKNSASDYSGSYTEFTLTTDSSGDSLIPNLDGKYTSVFFADDAEYYELRVIRTAASAATIYLAGVIVGPGIQPQGAVVTDWQSFPAVFGAGGNLLTADICQYKQDGNTIEVEFAGTYTGASTDTELRLEFPAGLTPLAQRIRQIGGSGYFYDASPITHYPVYLDVRTNGLQILPFAQSADPLPVIANGDKISARWSIEVAEWSGSGTVNLAQNDVTFGADDGSSDVFGPNGVLVPNVAFGTGVTSRDFTVPSGYDPAGSGYPIVEYYNGSGWSVSADNYTFDSGNNGNTNNYYGIQGFWANSTTYRVNFGNQGTRVSSSAADNGLAQWSDRYAAGDRYRIRFVSGSNAVGFGKATSTSNGLITTYTPTIKSSTLTVSSANYTVLGSDGYETILVSTAASNRTITLPVAADNIGRRIVVKKSDSGAGAVIIARSGSDTIDGSTSHTIYGQYASMTLIAVSSTVWSIESVSQDQRGGWGMLPVGAIVAYNPGYFTSTTNGSFTPVGPANTESSVNSFLNLKGWYVCDGGQPNDSRSPIWNAAGRYLPEIGNSRFLMGATTAGTAGGNTDNQINLAHNHGDTDTASVVWSSTTVSTTFTNPSMPAHYHSADSAGATLYIDGGSHIHFSAGGVGANTIASFGGSSTGFTLDPGATYGLRYGNSGQPGLTAQANTHDHPISEMNGLIGKVTGGQNGDTPTTTTGGAATFNKNVMNTNQTAHSHVIPSALSSTQSILPQYLSTFYIIRVF